MAKNIDLNVRLKGAEKAKKGLGGIDNKMKSLGKSAMAAAGGFFAARGLLNAFNSVIDAAGRQEKAIATLEQIMKSMGRYTPTASRRMQDYAKAIQEVTTFSDEAVLEGIGFLQTYKQIGDEVMPQAIDVMTDIAALMGGDMRTAANKVGKAAMGMTGELREVGITVDENIAKSGDLVAILNEVQKQVGGVAKAQGETMVGSLEQMKNAVGDAAEAIGTLLSPVVTDLAKDVKGLAEWWGEWLKNVKDTKPESEAENKRTKELSQEIKVLTSEIEYRLDVLRDEELLRKRAEDQGNRIQQQSALERLEIAMLRIQLKKLNEEREKEIEIEKNKPPTQPPSPPPPLEGFDLFLEKQRESIELKSQESEWLEKIKEQYPELAEAMGLVNKKTDDANDGWELFQENLNQAAAASVLTASTITSTSDALGAAEEAAKRAATAFISAEIQKAVSKWIASMLESSGPLAWLTAPLALAGGAAFGSAMGSAIERISFAQGGDFITSGPQMMLVGDNPGGRERVQVEPLSSPNISGPRPSINLTFNGPTDEDFVRDVVAPELDRVMKQNLA